MFGKTNNSSLSDLSDGLTMSNESDYSTGASDDGVDCYQCLIDAGVTPGNTSHRICDDHALQSYNAGRVSRGRSTRTMQEYLYG